MKDGEILTAIEQKEKTKSVLVLALALQLDLPEHLAALTEPEPVSLDPLCSLLELLDRLPCNHDVQVYLLRHPGDLIDAECQVAANGADLFPRRPVHGLELREGVALRCSLGVWRLLHPLLALPFPGLPLLPLLLCLDFLCVLLVPDGSAGVARLEVGPAVDWRWWRGSG